MEEYPIIRTIDIKQELIELKEMIDHTVEDCYETAYNREAVAYFKDYHNKENILKDCSEGLTLVCCLGKGKIVGTASLCSQSIKRLYVLPEFQNKGFGTLLLRTLEENALQRGIQRVDLYSTLPAKGFYLLLGYKILHICLETVTNNKKLKFFKMERDLTYITNR
jgi:GNAT superfamily N-acetyltransferase